MIGLLEVIIRSDPMIVHLNEKELTFEENNLPESIEIVVGKFAEILITALKVN